jgi:hypothetical protein
VPTLADWCVVDVVARTARSSGWPSRTRTGKVEAGESS